MKHFVLLGFAFLLTCSFDAHAQTAFNTSTIEGVWQVVDSNGDPIHYVEIYVKDDLYGGKIVKLFNEKNPEALRCTECRGDLKDKSVLGLTIITDMERGESKYGKGRILDYTKGSSSPCTIWMESENVIRVRSWWLFLFKTYSWYRIS